MPNKMLDAALAYARRGWPVFPCVPNGKEPAIPVSEGGHGVNDATTNEDMIREWWQKYPDANVAVHADGAGFVVVDYDPGSDADAFADKYGLPDTKLVARTPRGGTHEYYLLPADVRVPPSVGKLADKVDIRSYHSYVLLPPSKTKDGAYTWERNGSPAPAPQAFIDAAVAVKREENPLAHTWLIAEDLPHNIEAARAWLKTKARAAVEGKNGDRETYEAACMMRSFGLSQETALDAMLDVYNARCVPAWPYEQMALKVKNAYSYAGSPPGNMTPDFHHANARALFLQSEGVALADIPGRVQAESKLKHEELHQGRFRRYSYLELTERTPPDWLIDEVIPEEGYAILYGPPESFKSFIALDMGLCIAHGLKWHDRQSKQGRVLYVMGEGSFDAHQRIEAWLHTHFLRDVDPELFQVIEPAPMLMLDGDTDAFIAEAKRGGEWDLIIVDTIGRVMPGINDNAQDGARMFTAFATKLRQELGAATLALTHAPKDKPEVLLGSGVYEADADMIFNSVIIEKGKTIDLHQRKRKFTAPWPAAMGFAADKSKDSIVMRSAAPNKKQQSPNEQWAQQEFNVKFILKALRSPQPQELTKLKGKRWTTRALAEEVRRQGCKIELETLRTAVLGKYRGRPGWAVGHEALKPYYDLPSESWSTPVILPELPAQYRDS